MNRDGYREFLRARNLNSETIKQAIAIVEAFQGFLLESDGGKTLDSATTSDVQSFSEMLISEELNTFDNYLALLRYGAFVRNRALYVTTLEFLDGAEAFGNLRTKLGDEFGEAKRDEYFENVSVPPLGTPNERKPALVQQVLDRLETAEPEACKRIIGSGLRDLQDEWFQDAKTEYAACNGLDEYLARKSENFIAELEKHKAENKWWFVQEITDEVIDYVRQHPIISAGIREGNVVYEAKIPYMAKEWLAETDPQMKRYYSCHCPWVRESLRAGDVSISPTFCNCSAAFHKKSWEVIFGRSLRAEVVESILKGDERCMFSIHLPRDRV